MLRPATAEYVLSVLADQHRQQCRFDPEAESDIDLNFEATVADWRDACDLLPWRKLAHALNESWGMRRTEEEWHAVLEPAGVRSLRDVSEFIAASVSMPVLTPLGFLGASCHEASAFMAIRAALFAAGASVEKLRPSSPLAPFSRSYLHVFFNDIAKLAPGVLPPVTIRTPHYNAALLGSAISLLALTGASVSGAYLIAIPCGFLVIASYAMHWIAAKCAKPASVEFGDLKTFRDLSRLIANRCNV